MKAKLLFLAWSIYLWQGIQTREPLQLFFAIFFLLLHIGTLCHNWELRAEKAKAAVDKPK